MPGYALARNVVALPMVVGYGQFAIDAPTSPDRLSPFVIDAPT
jgi:hypothetical protein